MMEDGGRPKRRVGDGVCLKIWDMGEYNGRDINGRAGGSTVPRSEGRFFFFFFFKLKSKHL